jgi:hypothetical protein
MSQLDHAPIPLSWRFDFGSIGKHDAKVIGTVSACGQYANIEHVWVIWPDGQKKDIAFMLQGFDRWEIGEELKARFLKAEAEAQRAPWQDWDDKEVV